MGAKKRTKGEFKMQTTDLSIRNDRNESKEKSRSTKEKKSIHCNIMNIEDVRVDVASKYPP